MTLRVHRRHMPPRGQRKWHQKQSHCLNQLLFSSLLLLGFHCFETVPVVLGSNNTTDIRYPFLGNATSGSSTLENAHLHPEKTREEREEIQRDLLYIEQGTTNKCLYCYVLVADVDFLDGSDGRDVDCMTNPSQEEDHRYDLMYRLPRLLPGTRVDFADYAGQQICITNAISIRKTAKIRFHMNGKQSRIVRVVEPQRDQEGRARTAKSSMTPIINVNEEDPQSRRRLDPPGVLRPRTVGVHKVLMVTVRTPTRSPKVTPLQMISTFFGYRTTPDFVSVRKQYNRCTRNQLDFVPYNPQDERSLNGATEVRLDYEIDGLELHETIRNDVLTLVQDKLGINQIEGNIDHLIFCMPSGTLERGTEDWLGWGFISGFLIFANDRWCDRHMLLAHEIGHNMGFAHSGDRSSTVYGDGSDIMGYSVASINGPEYCFNGNKNWLAGWYASRSQDLSGVADSWVGEIYPFIDHGENIPFDGKVLYKVDDIFLQYNRAKSYNRGVFEYRDEVTVTRGPDFNIYQASYVLDGLSHGELISGAGHTVMLCKFLRNPDRAKISVFSRSGSTRCTADDLQTPAPSAFPPGAPRPLKTRDYDCSEDEKCGLCEGDCDNDDQCQDDLVCAQRYFHEPIPGCRGDGYYGSDYCVHPSVLGPTPPSPLPTGYPTPRPTRSPTPPPTIRSPPTPRPSLPPPDPTLAPTPHPTIPLRPLAPVKVVTPNIPNASHSLKFIWTCSLFFPCGRCEGHCTNDSGCAGDLICIIKTSTEQVPGCSGNGETSKGYCSRYEFAQPTDAPAPTAPTPLGIPPVALPSLKYLYQCSTFLPCSKCEGYCVNDSGCLGGLTCMKRTGDELVPGCSGLGKSAKGYCYDNTETLAPQSTVLPIDPPPAPTPSPTKLPTPAPTPGYDGPKLTYIWDCTQERQCLRCEGHCSSNHHCRDDLRCTQRVSDEPVPGCYGKGIAGQNYCYRNGDPLVSVLRTPQPAPPTDPPVDQKHEGPPLKFFRECTQANQCLRCEGHCSSNHHCRDDLRCTQRVSDEPVPGCYGKGIPRQNYCYRSGDPLVTILRTPEPQPTNPPTDQPTNPPTFPPVKRPVPNPIPNVITFPSVPKLKFLWRCSSFLPCGRCEGYCSSNAGCVGNLVCSQRDALQLIPGCAGEGTEGQNYCHRPGDAIVSPSPTVSPTRAPTPPPTTSQPTNEPTPIPTYKQTPPPTPLPATPQPTDTTSSVARPVHFNFPDLKYLWSCSRSLPCGRCEGFCLTATDCTGDLVCSQRKGTEPVPGCWGEGSPGDNYCHRLGDETVPPQASPTKAPIQTQPPKRNNLPNLKFLWQCSSYLPCGQCEGNCRTSNDCTGQLSCFRREGTEPVPGCSGEGFGGANYCYRPSDEEPTPAPVLQSTRNPTNSPTKMPRVPATPQPTLRPALPPRFELQLKYVFECNRFLPCGACEGACADDRGCARGTRCFLRQGSEPVPGCSGTGLNGRNYCIRV